MNVNNIKQCPNNNFNCFESKFNVICVNAVSLADVKVLKLAASRSERATKQEVLLIISSSHAESADK